MASREKYNVDLAERERLVKALNDGRDRSPWYSLQVQKGGQTTEVLLNLQLVESVEEAKVGEASWGSIRPR